MRRTYTTKARFFKDDPREIDIAWYPADPAAGCLPFPSKINSLLWVSNPWEAKGVGEVFNAPREFNWRKVLNYAVGLGPCSNAQTFAEGETFDASLPPQLYNQDGIPLCCKPPIVADGGFGWGGEAVFSVDEPDPGVDCQHAQDYPADVFQFFTVPAGEEQWWHTTTAVLGFRCFTCSPSTPNDLNLLWRFFVGPCPGGLALVFQQSGNFGQHQDSSVSTSGDLWVRVANLGGSDISYGFMTHEGIC